MPQRPYLEYGAAISASAALGQIGSYRVSCLSHELDAKAKEDRDLWEQCEAQDFEDHPRNRGKFRLSRTDLAELDWERTPRGSVRVCAATSRWVPSSSRRHVSGIRSTSIGASIRRASSSSYATSMVAGVQQSEHGVSRLSSYLPSRRPRAA